MKNSPESNVPNRVTKTHIGRRILFKLPNQAVISEGEISELSPEAKYFHVGNAWIANETGAVLAMLSTQKKKHRSSPFTRNNK